MKKSNDKTNVMRILQQNKIDYISHYYINSSAINGKDVAKVLNQDENQVFKTLVTASSSKKIMYF